MPAVHSYAVLTPELLDRINEIYARFSQIIASLNVPIGIPIIQWLPNKCRIYQALTLLYQPRKFGEDLFSISWDLFAHKSPLIIRNEN